MSDLTQVSMIRTSVLSSRGPQGPKGDAFTYEDFTPEQLDGLLANRAVRTDAAQALTDAERTRARENIGAASAHDVERMIQPDATDYVTPVTIDEGVVSEVLDCALTYYKQGAYLVYGNSYTANNEAPDRRPYMIEDDQKQYAENVLDTWEDVAVSEGDEPTDGGESVQDSELVDEATGGVAEPDKRMRLQLDCSSFIWLVMSGVPYERSRYASPDAADNVREYAWGMDWKGKEAYYDNDATQVRVLANGIARYCDDRGWGFSPKADASNLRTGDLIFFKPLDDQTPVSERYYLRITHVGIFLWMNGYGQAIIMDCSTSSESRPVRVRVISTAYRGCIVRAARLPLTGAKRDVARAVSTDMKSMGGVAYSDVRSKLLTLTTPLRPSTFYTVGVRIAQDAAQHAQSFAFRPSGIATAFDRRIRPHAKTADDYYESHFFVTLDNRIISRPDGRLDIEGATGVDIISYSYYEEGDEIPAGKKVGDYISGGCQQICTQIEWAELCEGVYQLDHRRRLRSDERWKHCEAAVTDDTTSLQVPIDSGWTELTFRLYAVRTNTTAGYISAFMDDTTAANQRLLYLSTSTGTKLLCRGLMRRIGDGRYILSLGSYNASASSANSDALTPYVRSICTTKPGAYLRFDHPHGFANGTTVAVDYR